MKKLIVLSVVLLGLCVNYASAQVCSSLNHEQYVEGLTAGMNECANYQAMLNNCGSTSGQVSFPHLPDPINFGGSACRNQVKSELHQHILQVDINISNNVSPGCSYWTGYSIGLNVCSLQLGL